MTAQYDLSGRIAVVTGAAGGFGTAIVSRLTAAGAIPVLWDLPAALEMLPDRDMPAYAVDVTDETSVTTAADAVMSRFGQIDILVNNAGIVADPMPTWDIPVAVFRRILEVNLVGAF